MSNVFYSGAFYNSQALWDKVNVAMSAAGWTIRSTILADTDTVYTSAGEDGYAFNYVRVAHKVEELGKWNKGWPQRLDEDGYTDYLNFFAYQYYNSGGISPIIDGYGEIGVFGPRLYATAGSGSGDIQWNNLRTGTVADPRWTNMFGDMPFDGSNNDRRDSDTVKNTVFDGINFIYYFSRNTFYRYNISTGANDSLFSSEFGGMLAGTYVRERDRFIVLRSNNSAVSGSQCFKHEFDEDGVMVSGPTPIANFPWGTGNMLRASVGISKYIYAFQGDAQAAALYNVTTDTWSSISNYPVSTNTRGHRAVIVPKGAGGIANHRIYVNRGLNGADLHFIDLDDNGFPVGGLTPTWQTATSLPFTPSGGTCLEFDGYNRLLYSPADAGTTDRELYYQDINQEGTQPWSLVGVNYMFANLNETSTITTHYGPQSRVRAHSNEPQKYWIFANKDRLIVVTKSATGKYHHCYIGRVNSYFNDTLQVRTTGAVATGLNQVIPMNSTESLTVGQKIQIYDIDRVQPVVMTGTIQSFPYQALKTEHVQIVAILPGVSITVADIKNSYPTNALIGIDIQNVIATVSMTRYAQALNRVNTPGVGVGNDMASGDPAEQVYVYEPGVNLEQALLADTSDRTGEFVLWPYVVFSEGTTNKFSGKEVRGQLIEMYSCGNGRGTSEDIVSINGVNYIIFHFLGMSDVRYTIIGPIV